MDTRHDNSGALDADDELVDVVNLSSDETGAKGIIFVSTSLGQHAARVKWFPVRAGRDLPCLSVMLEDPPRVINHGISPREARQAEPAVVAWVALNRDALQRFWDDGLSWTRKEVNAFFDGLRKLP